MTAPTSGPLALITNDDGIDSPGLAVLARCAVEAGWDTLVAAPATESSGTSAALVAAERNDQIVIQPRTLPGLDHVDTYALAAHPALITLVALRGGFGRRPAIVLSGVNRGANIGRAVLHSGTVGAALTGAINGTRAMAVSLDVDLNARADVLWGTAASVVSDLLPVIMELDAGAVLNVNIPNRPPDQLRDPRWAPLATFGRIRSRIDRSDDGLIKVATIVEDGELEPGTDAELLIQGHTTITALRSVTDDPELMKIQLPS